MSRDADALYKDKIEVSLDGRQIFYLFFGGAVIVGLVFVLGVMVGRRVEARGHVERARTSAAADPLAALDRLEASNGLTFKSELMGRSRSGSDAPDPVERAIAAKAEPARTEPTKAEPAKPAPVKAEPAKGEVKAEPAKAEPAKAEKSAAKAEPAKAESRSDRPEKRVDPDPAEPTVEQKPVTRPEPGPEERKAEKKPDKAERADPKNADPKNADPKNADPKNADPKNADPKKEVAKLDETAKKTGEDREERKPRYTLQLSSFQDRAEAEAFLSSIKASGYQAYVTEAAVAGKGTFYRVRMGSYRSLEAANDAKSEFEKSSKKTASVMRL